MNPFRGRRYEVWIQAKMQVKYQILDQVEDQVRYQISDQVEDRVGDVAKYPVMFVDQVRKQP